ncbi:NACHT domain-containing protein [Fusarium sp. LHS14.1]|nr:NACHT domain-containing protein [Fusarium sp. LHS14.1]
MTSSQSSSEIRTLASECSELFQDCAHSGPEDAQASVASLFKAYGAWCFNLGVFAPPAASLDQTLRYSDEIRGFVMQLLLMLRRNLEFIKIQGQPKDSLRSTKPRPNENEGVSVEELEGTVEEALQAIMAVLQRLDRLGTTIRKHSASSLSSRLKSFAEQENDEKYRLLATNIVAFKYPMATPSLRTQLVEAMTDRGQRLRYIRQRQQKTAAKDRQGLKTRNQHNPNTSNHKPSDFESDQPMSKTRAATLRDQGDSRSSGNTTSQDTGTTPSTDSWEFLPTSSAMERTRCDGSKSVISSLEANTTRMVGDLNNYPEPPTHEEWSQDPKCPTCWSQLKESELEDKKWRRHVDTDLEPYVCISEECRKPLQFFADLSLWENHMRNQHSTK